MLAYRNPSNEDSDSIFNYTLKLDAYQIFIINTVSDSFDFAIKDITGALFPLERACEKISVN